MSEQPLVEHTKKVRPRFRVIRPAPERIKHRSIPPTITFQADRIPEGWKAIPCWIVWQEMRGDDGQWWKVPHDRHGGPMRGTPRPEDGRPFDEVAEQARRSGFGVGAVCGRYGEVHLCIGDVDDAVADDGSIAPFILDHVTAFGTYTELSPSRKGLRFAFTSKVPFETLRGTILTTTGKYGAELACRNAWYTVTGFADKGTPAELADLTEKHPDLAADMLHSADLDRQLIQAAEWMEPAILAVPSGADVIVEALKHLARWRCNDFWGWHRVLRECKSGGEALFPLFMQWSATCPEKFKGEDDCRRWWDAERDPPPDVRPLTTRSLVWDAKRDDPSFTPDTAYEPLDHTGNGRMIARIGAGEVAYVSVGKKRCWYAWDGKRWKVGSVEYVEKLAKDAVSLRLKALRGSYAKMMDIKDMTAKAARKQALDRVWRWCSESRMSKGIHGAVHAARSESSLWMDESEFDRKWYLVNFQNGTLDLRTLELRPHDPADHLTQTLPYDWNPRARCSLWSKFLRRSFPNPNVRRFVGRFLGSLLSGRNNNKLMTVFWGVGDNGKTVLAETLLSVLGEYAMKADRRLLMKDKRSNEGDRTKARLPGKRAALCVETERGGEMDETEVKELTGGDTAAMRLLYGEQFDTTQTWQLLLLTNHKPRVSGTDPAIWNRIALVEMVVQFLRGDKRRIEGLKHRIAEEEGAGVLAWLARRCCEWIEGGETLELPDEVKDASIRYKGESDGVAQFVEERLEFGEGYKTHSSRRMYPAYCGWHRVWAAENAAPGSQPVSSKELNVSLQEVSRRIVRKPQDPYYYGVKLKPAVSEGEDESST